MPVDRTLHVLIADDERRLRGRLKELLEARPAVETVSAVGDGEEAARFVREEAPDLAFLDVKMPGLSGIEVVQDVGPERMPPTVFVTAFEEYAHRAFDLAAVDFLLKPFDAERFGVAFERALGALAMERVESVSADDLATDDASAIPTRDLVRRIVGNGARPRQESQEPTEYLERFTVEKRDEIAVIPVREVQCVTAEGVYVQIHTRGDSHLLRDRLYEIEEKLDPAEFVRIHRSTIVRLDSIDSLQRRSSGDYRVRLDDGSHFRVSRSRQDELLRRLETGPRE